MRIHTELVDKIRDLLEEAGMPYSLIDDITNMLEDWEIEAGKYNPKRRQD